MGSPFANGDIPKLPYIDLSYDHKNLDVTAKELVFKIQPKWRDHPEQIRIVQFKEGITNTASEPLRVRHVLRLTRL